jgi:hypothetical protein
MCGDEIKAKEIVNEIYKDQKLKNEEKLELNSLFYFHFFNFYFFFFFISVFIKCYTNLKNKNEKLFLISI